MYYIYVFLKKTRYQCVVTDLVRLNGRRRHLYIQGSVVQPDVPRITCSVTRLRVMSAGCQIDLPRVHALVYMYMYINRGISVRVIPRRSHFCRLWYTIH